MYMHIHTHIYTVTTLTGELIGLGGEAKTEAGGRATVEAGQLETPPLSRLVAWQHDAMATAPHRNRLQQPDTPQQAHLQRTWGGGASGEGGCRINEERDRR